MKRKYEYELSVKKREIVCNKIVITNNLTMLSCNL